MGHAQFPISFMVTSKKNPWAAVFIAVACLIWATDTFVRYPASLELNPKVIVLLEHLFGLFCILPWLFFKHAQDLKKVQRKHIPLILIVGVGGSALGSLFFTRSIHAIGPSSSTLFQMIQPMVVVGLAYVFLKERHSGVFFQCAFWVILNALFIGFPHFDFGFSIQNRQLLEEGVLYAFSAMLLWGASTVAGKALLRDLPPGVVVFFRWITAIVFMGGLVVFDATPIHWSTFATWETIGPLAYLGAVPGALAMIIYYYGLQELPASVATFIELLYALLGVVLPALNNHQALSFLQILGTMTLLLAITVLAGLEESVTTG